MLPAILTMHLLPLVQITSGVIAVLSLLLFAVAVMVRFVSSLGMMRREEFRKAALPHLCAYLEGKQGREALLGILGKERHPSLELLMEQSERMDPDALKRLAPIYSGLSYLPEALRDLGSRHWSRRLRAAEQLGYLGEESAIPPLMNALRDESLDVRLAAALSLARLGCNGAVLPIIGALNLPGEISQRRVAEILSMLGRNAEESLLGILQDRSSDPSALCIATRTCGLLRLRGAVPPLQLLLDHPNEDVRINAVRTLASLGDISSARRIREIRDDASWKVRSAVMRTLGILRDQSSIPVLTESLGDPEWWVRHHAADSLRQLGEGGLDALRRASTDHADAFARDSCRLILQQHGLQGTPEIPA